MKKFGFLFLAFAPVALQAQTADSLQRKVNLQGALNFRDIGGYTTADGKQVQWGKIYRSADISKLTEADLDTLENRKINYVLDFRGPAEVEAAPDKIPASATRISLPAGSENVGDKKQMGEMMMKMAAAGNSDSIIYPFYANPAPFAARYKPVFETLMNNNEDSAVVFHCSAGKDRTGICAALILYALGVDEITIMNDYLASNYYRQPDNQRMQKMMVESYHMKEEVAAGLMGVKEDYLNATFTSIKKHYGSVDNFLEKELGLTKKMKKKLIKKYTN